MSALACRHCGRVLVHTFVDLGSSPLSNSYVRSEGLALAERFYPLHAYVCDECFLVQLPAVVDPEEIFRDYAYFSSYSDTWLAHARDYAGKMIARFHLGAASRVVEIASNDGYLLQFFQKAGVPVLGVEPALNVGAVAASKGIPTRAEFFGARTAAALAAEGLSADLLVGNNVLAHVPDINDLVCGLKLLLRPGGAITMEFPHLVRLIEGNQFDTIYHEHYSYLSLLAVNRIFSSHGLTVFDVDEIPTHGGSLRVYAGHAEEASRPVAPAVAALAAREEAFGLGTLARYGAFAEQVRATKRKLLSFLIAAKEEGRSIAGYGAPAKGNTLLNYCGVRSDLVDYTVDRSPHKQGCFLPGTRLPIHPPERLRETKPDYVLILPWNLKDEVMEQMADVRSWGGRFVVAIPEVRIYP